MLIITIISTFFRYSSSFTVVVQSGFSILKYVLQRVIFEKVLTIHLWSNCFKIQDL